MSRAFLSLALLLIVIGRSEGDFEKQDINSFAPESNCRIPERWEGQWFQSGIGPNILINGTGINVKGDCIEAHRNKFLFFNRQDNCYRCVAFHERHSSVLQYKETFCNVKRLPLSTICSRISGDANLFSMFRIGGDFRVACPFQGSYELSYNRGQRECSSPVSRMETCLNTSKILLNYQACPDVPGSESSREELECLASWKEGSSRYLLGLIKYKYYASYEERFRCFIYEKIGSSGHTNPNNFNMQSLRALRSEEPSIRDVEEPPETLYRISQSGDGTCNGISASEGSKILTLTSSIKRNSCTLPIWLFGNEDPSLPSPREYESMDRSWILTIDEGGFYLKSQNGTLRRAECSVILHNHKRNQYLKGVFHLKEDCNSEFVCIHVHLRKAAVLEVQIGAGTKNEEEACEIDGYQLGHFPPQSIPFIDLRGSRPETRSCPTLGHFQITDANTVLDPNDCLHSLSFGCSEMHSLVIKAHCQNSEKFYTEEYSCLEWWQKGKTINLIAEEAHPTRDQFTMSGSKGVGPTDARRRTCFILKEIEVPIKNGTESTESQETRLSPSSSTKRIIFSRNEMSCSSASPHLENKDGQITFQSIGIGEFKGMCYDPEFYSKSSPRIGNNLVLNFLTLFTVLLINSHIN